MTKKNIRNKELYMESIKRGSLVGGIIWVCVVIFISINYKTMGKAALPWLVPMLAGYIVLGALLQLGTVKKRMINGLAALWSIIIIMFALICIAYYIPDWIRYIIVLSFFCPGGDLGGGLLVSVAHGAEAEPGKVRLCPLYQPERKTFLQRRFPQKV